MLALMRILPADTQNRWNIVSQKIGGKTQSQCFQHWNRVLDPSINKGPWSVREEQQLQQLVEELGTSWAHVASHIANRTDIQCRYQWKRLIKSKAQPWTKDEVLLLQECVCQVRPDSNLPDLKIEDWTWIANEHCKKNHKAKDARCVPRGAVHCMEKWHSLQNKST
jgi:hypothetical protein